MGYNVERRIRVRWLFPIVEQIFGHLKHFFERDSFSILNDITKRSLFIAHTVLMTIFIMDVWARML